MTPVIDMHTHFLPTAVAQALVRSEGFPRLERHDGAGYIHYGPGSGHALLPAMESIELRLEDMDRQGIDYAILSITVPGVDGLPAEDGAAVARSANDQLADIVSGHPDRFAALAVLAARDPAAAAAELERAVGLGLRGATVFSNVAGQPLDEIGVEEILAVASALEVPILLHPTHPLSARGVDIYALLPTLGFLADTTTAVLRLVLAGIYDRLPDLRLILPHTASLIPWLAGRIDYEAQRMPGGMGSLQVPPSEHLRRLYADIVCDWPPAIRTLVEFLGAERIMFGSDYPLWDPARSLRALAAAGLEPETDALIREGTARALFGIQPPTYEFT